MGRKKVENQYGVQMGDIFSDNKQNCNRAFFYQVVALHGESKVKVREIDQICVAFDGYYEGIVSVPGCWRSHRTRIFTVREWQGKPCLDYINRLGVCCPELDRSETHMYMVLQEYGGYPFHFRDEYPEIAEQLDLKTGSGVYAVDKPFEWIDDDCRALIRYPDGREVETVFQELMRSDKLQESRAFETECRSLLKEMGALQLLEEQRQIMFKSLKSSLYKNMKDK